MTIFDKNNNKIAFKFSVKDFKDGLTFFSEDKDFLQMGSWKYAKGKKLLAHIHNVAPREISRTQECIFVIHGELKAFLYDENRNPLETLHIKAQEGLVLLSGGHGYEILQDDTVVLEVKNGPYVGAEADRRRIE